MLRIRHQQRAAANAAAWIEVDHAAIRHNLQQHRRLLPPGCALLAVVKANAYGHGMVEVARTAMAAGAAGLVVGSVDEGVALRTAGIQAPILVAGPMALQSCADVVAAELVPSLEHEAQVHALAAMATERATAEPLSVEIEIDTGMRRHGVQARDAASLCSLVRAKPSLRLSGAFTHFAALRPDDRDALREQHRHFTALLATLDGDGHGRRFDAAPLRSPSRLRRHACNTLGTLLLPEAHGDAVRIGGGLYGFDPLRGHGPVALRPALALKCRLADLRDANAGDPVGYGPAHVCRADSRLGLLPIGYADGLARALWSGQQVLVRSQRARIVGLISMNLTIVDVTGVSGASIGDEVVLLGEQGNERIVAEDRVAEGGSVYEVTALLRSGLPRLHDRASDEQRRVAPHHPCTDAATQHHPC